MTSAFAIDSVSPSTLRAVNYAPELETLRRSGKGFRSVPLRQLVAGCGESYWSVFKRLDCAPGQGVELLSQTDMFASEPEGRVIRRDSMPRPSDHEVQRWQILIAGAGQMGEANLFGQSIIADGRLARRYLGPHAVALTFEQPGGVVNLWVYAFLNTILGLKAIKACAFGTSVPGLRLDLLGNLPIPLATSERLLDEVANQIRAVVKQRDKYQASITAARQALLSDPTIARALAMATRPGPRAASVSPTVDSLCAWNYISCGGALEYLGRAWSGRLRDALVDDGAAYGARFARVACTRPHGVNLLSQRDIFMMRPVPKRVRRPAVADSELFAPPDSIVVGSRGQVTEGSLFGKVELGCFGPADSVITGDLVRLQFRRDLRHVAYAYLSSKLGFALLRSLAIGTSIPALHLGLLEALPFPDPPRRTRDAIETLIEEGISARQQAASAEEAAIALVSSSLSSWLA